MANTYDLKSDRVRVKINIYPQADDPILDRNTESITFTGKDSRSDSGAVIACQTSKGLENFSGNFSFTVKPGNKKDNYWLDRVTDGDWVDIDFIRNGNSYYTMTGIIDSIRPAKSVGGSGATTENIVISGRDLGVTIDQTPIWFINFPSKHLTALASNMIALLTSKTPS